MTTMEYDDVEMSLITELSKKEALIYVENLNLSGYDKLIALDMIYNQILKDKYYIF